MRYYVTITFLASIGLVSSTRHAYAYLDPGTASLMLQGIIGGIAALAATVGIYWQRTKSFVVRQLRKKRPRQPPS